MWDKGEILTVKHLIEGERISVVHYTIKNNEKLLKFASEELRVGWDVTKKI